MPARLLFAISVCIGLAMCAPARSARENAGAEGCRALRVVDGDTMTVSRGAEKLTVRAYGIDCPEKAQPFGAEARAAASLAVAGRPLELEILYLDRYGRSVAVVYLEGGATLQEALLEKGLAWVAPKYCKRRECLEWAALQEHSRRAGKGLWAEENPVPPWRWRKAPLVPEAGAIHKSAFVPWQEKGWVQARGHALAARP